MPCIMQENSQFGPELLIFRNINIFSPERSEGIAHEVIGSQRVMETGVYGTGIYKIGKTHLLNPAQALVKRITDHIQKKRVIYCNKSVNRIVDDFKRTCTHFDFVKRIQTQLQI